MVNSLSHKNLGNCSLNTSYNIFLKGGGIYIAQKISSPVILASVIELIIVAFLENATIGYSLESVCVCVCVRVCVCVCFCTITQRNRSRNTKSEYIVVNENSADEFDIELHRIKVKVTVGVQKFSPFTTIQTVRTYSSILVQARNLILSIYFHLILIYKINECRHVLMILRIPGSCKEAKIQQYRTSDIYKQIIFILSCLSDSAPGKRGSYFQAQALYLSLRTS